MSTALTREDLALALSVVLLGLLMMMTRRNAVSQVVGFMSLENGLILAATGAEGMPLVVEISVAFSVSDRLHRLRHLLVPHPRTLRHRRSAERSTPSAGNADDRSCRSTRSRSSWRFLSVGAIVLAAVCPATGCGRLNVLASGITDCCAAPSLFVD